MPRVSTRNSTPVSPRSSIVGFTTRTPRRNSVSTEDASKTDASSDEEEERKQIASPRRRQMRADAVAAKKTSLDINLKEAAASTAVTRARLMNEYGTKEQRQEAEDAAHAATTAVDEARLVAGQREAAAHGQSQNAADQEADEAEHVRAVNQIRAHADHTMPNATADQASPVEQQMELEDPEWADTDAEEQHAVENEPAIDDASKRDGEDADAQNNTVMTTEPPETETTTTTEARDDHQQDETRATPDMPEASPARGAGEAGTTSTTDGRGGTQVTTRGSEPVSPAAHTRDGPAAPVTTNKPEKGSSRAHRGSNQDELPPAAPPTQAAETATTRTSTSAQQAAGPKTTAANATTTQPVAPGTRRVNTTTARDERHTITSIGTSETPVAIRAEHATASGIHEGEEALDIEYTAQEWNDFESRFHDTEFRVSFTLDAPTVFVPERGYWGLPEFKAGITQVCASRDVDFDDDGLRIVGGQTQVLIGKARTQNRALWRVMRRGYIKLHGAMVWIQPMFTGRQQSNLDLVELEYRNANHVTVEQLRTIMNHWGALEPLIVSHGANDERHAKWPAIMCTNTIITSATTGDMAYTFRLCFEDETTTNAVYRAFLRQEQVDELGIPHARTIRLSPIRNTDWCAKRECLIRPTAAGELTDLSRRLHISGVSAEITPRQVEERLATLGFPDVRIVVNTGRTTGTATAPDDGTATRIFDMYGPNAHARITVGNIRVFVNRPGENGGMRCYRCNQTGHFARDCPRRQGRGDTLARTSTPADRDWNPRSQMHARGRADERWRAPQYGRTNDAMVLHQDARRQEHTYDRRSSEAVAPRWRLPTATASTDVARVPHHHHERDTPSIMAQVHNLVSSQVRVQTDRIAGELRAEITAQTQVLATQITEQAHELTTIRTAQATTATETSQLIQMVTAMARFMKVPDFLGGSQGDGTGTPRK